MSTQSDAIDRLVMLALDIHHRRGDPEVVRKATVDTAQGLGLTYSYVRTKVDSLVADALRRGF